MAEDTPKKPITDEIATTEKDLDIFSGYLTRLENPDPVLRTEAAGKGLKLYDEVDRDPHAGAVLQTRYLSVAGREWEIVPGEESARGQDIAAFVKQSLEDTNFTQGCQELLEAILYGFYVGEVMWRPTAAGIVPAKLMGKHPRRFVFTHDRELRLLTPQNMVDGEQVPPRKFVTFSWGSTDNPYGKALGQKLWWPVWFKKNGIKFWLIFLEKFGMPTAVGKYPPGAPPDQQKALLDVLDAIQNETGVKIPNTMAIDLLEAGRQGKASYETLCDYMDRQISKAVLGQTLTTEVKGEGSYAAGKVHDDVRQDILKADADLLSECLNDSLVKWIVDFNFPGVVDYPRLSIRTEKEQDLKPLADRDRILVKDIGLPVPKRYFYDTYNVPEPEGDEELVEPPSGGSIPDESEVETDFAEKKNGFDRAAAAQGLIDRQADEYTAQGAAIFENWTQRIKAHLAAAEDLAAARDGIAGLYDTLPAGKLGRLLAEALQGADRVGVRSIPSAEFAEAQWGPGKPFAEAVDFFRAKGLTIAGVAKADLVAEVKDDILRAMKEGTTLGDFRANLDTLFEKHGYAKIEPYRVDTIFRTNMQAAYQAGRYRQMTHPAVTAARPFWRYVAVLDTASRPEHAAMHGRIFRHDHPVWRTWYPANGFNCRCQVVTVSAREMEREGWTVETEDPTGLLIEPVDAPSGMKMPARPLMPDSGFGARAGDLEGLLDDKRSRKELSKIAWKERKGQPGPKDLGRPVAGKIPAALWTQSPGRASRLEDLMRGHNLSESAAIDRIEDEYRRVMGISPKETMGVLKGPDGEILTVDMNGLAHAMLNRNDKRERFIRYFRQVIEQPFEILLTEYETAGRKKTKLRKKYIGLFQDEKKESVIVVGEISPEGWVMWNVMNARKGTIDRQRRGVKILYGK